MIEDDSPKEAETVNLHFQKCSLFRSIHGAQFFGTMANSGHVHLTVYTERPPIPVIKSFKKNPDGTLGDEVTDPSKNKTGLILELEAHLVLDLDSAISLATFLTETIEQAEQQGLLEDDDAS